MKAGNKKFDEKLENYKLKTDVETLMRRVDGLKKEIEVLKFKNKFTDKANLYYKVDISFDDGFYEDKAELEITYIKPSYDTEVSTAKFDFDDYYNPQLEIKNVKIQEVNWFTTVIDFDYGTATNDRFNEHYKFRLDRMTGKVKEMEEIY